MSKKFNLKGIIDKISNSIIMRVIILLSVICTFILLIFSLISSFNSAIEKSYNLNGSWKLHNTVIDSRISRFNNIKLGFLMTIKQNGNNIEGSAEKTHENNQEIEDTNKIHLNFNGTIIKDSIIVRFTEIGKLRTSLGSITWYIKDKGRKLQGRFTSTAANSSGFSEAYKIK